jgi:hypothetical protein
LTGFIIITGLLWTNFKPGYITFLFLGQYIIILLTMNVEPNTRRICIWCSGNTADLDYDKINEVVLRITTSEIIWLIL